MVAIVIKYSEEELAPKSQIFYCGAGLIKCQILSSEKAVSRFSKESDERPEVLKVHYAVAEGEYAGAENTIEFDLWDDSVIDFGSGKSAPRSKLASQNYAALCVAAGFDSWLGNSDLLNGKLLLINHEIKKGELIEEVDEYGNKVAKLDDNGAEQFYPDRSDVARKGKKFARVDSAKPATATPVTAPAKPAANVAAPVKPVAAPVAAPVTYAPPPTAELAIADDDMPWE